MADTLLSSLLFIVLLLTALLLSISIFLHRALNYLNAYSAGPTDILALLDVVDSSISENEAYDADLGRIQKLDDKIRMGRLLQEIQRQGDDLREHLHKVLLVEGGTRLRLKAQVLWLLERAKLEERVRRLDLLRMRFLVVQLSIMSAQKSTEPLQTIRDAEKGIFGSMPKCEKDLKSTMAAAIHEGLKRKPPLRRLTTQAMGHRENTGHGQKAGWMGVVAELQSSPLMHRRHASIEREMSSPSTSPRL